MPVRTAAVAVAMSCGVAAAALDAGAPPADDEPIFVGQRVRTNYEADTAALDRLLGAPLEKRVAVQPRATLSGIISDNYRVGVSNAPGAYALLSSYILRRNGLHAGEALRAGTSLLVPDIPPIAKTRPNPDNRYNAVAKLSIAPSIVCGRSGRLFGVFPTCRKRDAARAAVFETDRVGASEVLQVRTVTRATATELLARGATDLYVINFRITIKLADGGGAPHAAGLLSASEVATLVRALSAPPAKKPVLVILDDGWPSDGEFVASKRFLLDAIAKVRKKYRMGPPSFPASLMNVQQLECADPSGRRCAFPSRASPAEANHADLIRRAIEPLRALDVRSDVTIVYVPLFVAYNGARDILRELIEINLISRHMGARLGDPVPLETRLSSHTMALQILKGVSDAVSGDVLQTDQAVVEAVLKFFDLRAEFPSEPFLLSMSWTVPNLAFQPYIPPEAYGLAIAAAGNDGDTLGTTVYDTMVQFASRSRFPGDVLAVMNMKPDGTPDCSTSLLEVRPDVLGFGFPGYVSPSVCGTSFSTPRVAWLIAAREAVLDTHERRVGDWISRLRAELRGMRDDSLDGIGRMRLRVDKLFAHTVGNEGSQP